MELSDRGARVVAGGAGVLATLAVSEMVGKVIDFVLGPASAAPTAGTLIANGVRLFLGPLFSLGVGICAGVIFHGTVKRRLIDGGDEPTVGAHAAASSGGTVGDFAWGTATFVVVFVLMLLAAVAVPSFFVGSQVLSPVAVVTICAMLAPVFAVIATISRVSSRRAARERRANLD